MRGRPPKRQRRTDFFATLDQDFTPVRKTFVTHPPHRDCRDCLPNRRQPSPVQRAVQRYDGRPTIRSLRATGGTAYDQKTLRPQLACGEALRRGRRSRWERLNPLGPRRLGHLSAMQQC